MSSTLLLLLLTSYLLARVSAMSKDIYLNCGGPMLYRDSAGNVWVGDEYPAGNYSYFNTGRPLRTEANITGTDDPELYATERFDGKSGPEMTYEIPVENGTYDVLLHFAEVFRKAQEPDARKFNVFIERRLVLEEYDMYALYGGYTAIIESFTTTVDDGKLTIDFVRGSVQNPKISAIEVHPAAPSAAPSVSNAPSVSASPTLSSAPSSSPTVSAAPSSRPSLRPTKTPTKAPTEAMTTAEPEITTAAATADPETTTKATTAEPVTTVKVTTEEATTEAAMKPETTFDAPTEEAGQSTVEATTKPATTTKEPETTPATTEAATTAAERGPVWEQVGDDIDWMGSKDPNGFAEDNILSMSLDGNVVAIGQTQDADDDDFTGRVSLFKYIPYFGWNRFGDELNRKIEQDAAAFGYSVSLNEDGKAIAVGDPGDGFLGVRGRKGRAYVYVCDDNGGWVLRGEPISPSDEGEDAGRAVSLSADGMTVAVVNQITDRIPGPPTFVRVYRFNEDDDQWRPLGQGIFGRLASVNDPFSIDLCRDGTTLSISSTVPGTGYVESYKYNPDSGMWEMMGEPIESKSTSEAVGIAVSMSEDGSIVAFGTRLFESSNLVRVYKFDNDEWKQVGDDINSRGALNARRLTLSVSGDGQRVAIGPQDKTSISSVYGYDGQDWVQIGENIPSYELRPAGLQLQSIALSGDGDRVAVVAPGGKTIAVYDEV